MIFQRYFKVGQRVLLKAIDPDKETDRTELLTAYMDGGEDNIYILSLPYGNNATEQYPFTEQMTFEISSEAMGLGIRITGAFLEKIDGQRISLQVQADLQMFQRRDALRIDCKVGLRFTRGQGTLKALRETWEKNIQVLHAPKAKVSQEGFNPCQVNISSGGIRFGLRPPVHPAELCLMLINLNDDQVPICTLAEIVWTRPEQDETIIVSGMRFINILDEDQARLENFINNRSTNTS